MGCCFSKEPMVTVVHEKEVDWTIVKYEDTTPFVLPVRLGKVVKVYDGDTFTLAFVFNGILHRTQVRMLGIDTPEIRGSSEVEKTRAKAARSELQRLILDKMVEVSNTKMEAKWGRLLADVWVDGVHVNAHMLREGFAVPYDGTTKTETWN
jgi:micrococcal nuclease